MFLLNCLNDYKGFIKTTEPLTHWKCVLPKTKTKHCFLSEDSPPSVHFVQLLAFPSFFIHPSSSLASFLLHLLIFCSRYLLHEHFGPSVTLLFLHYPPSPPPLSALTTSSCSSLSFYLCILSSSVLLQRSPPTPLTWLCCTEAALTGDFCLKLLTSVEEGICYFLTEFILMF